MLYQYTQNDETGISLYTFGKSAILATFDGMSVEFLKYVGPSTPEGDDISVVATEGCKQIKDLLKFIAKAKKAGFTTPDITQVILKYMHFV